jgi:hypothetical protein
MEMVPHYTLLERALKVEAGLPENFEEAFTVASLVLAGLLVKVTRTQASELLAVVREMVDTMEDIIR